MENKTPLHMLIQELDEMIKNEVIPDRPVTSEKRQQPYKLIKQKATELLPVEKEREDRLQERVKGLEGFLKEVLNKSEPHPHYLSFELFEQGTELLTKTQTP